MSSTFRIVPLIPGLVNEVALEIFLYFVAIDRDGPSALVLVCTAWRDAVLSSKFLQSLRRKRRRPNPALRENRDKLEEGISIVSFDGGGPGSMSQLRMLEEFMARLAFKEKAKVDELLPADYFDLMGGVGFGGLVALLLGRLRMTISQAMEELAMVGTVTFTECEDIVSPDVNMVRLRKALESMLECNGHSVGMKLRDTSDSRCKVVLFAAATEVTDHCHPFRTYRSPRKSLECTFVDAACATMANPEYFSSISIGPRLRKQNFSGIPHNFHNPMREVLKEAKLVFGEKTPVSLMLSLGAGQPARHASRDDQVTRRSLIHCDGVARDLQDQLHGFTEYLRLNVDKGMENIELDNWHKLGSIETYTNVYLEMNQITGYIDRAVQLLLQRNGSVTLGNLSGTSADCVVKFHSESLEKYLAMEFKQMQDVIQELGIEKVTLVDAIGNDIPIPKHFCPTYAMLLDVIKVYFRHQKPPGSDLVERGDYRLLHGSRRSILDPVEWDQLEKFRLKVEMSMILCTRNNDKARCPRCRSRSEGPPTNGWATCPSCSGQFQIEDQLLEYEVQSGDNSHNEAEDNSIVTPAIRESVQTSQGRLPIKVNKKIAKEEELKFRLISVVNLLDTLSNVSLANKKAPENLPSMGLRGGVNDQGFVSPFGDLSSSFPPMPYQTVAANNILTSIRDPSENINPWASLGPNSPQSQSLRNTYDELFGTRASLSRNNRPQYNDLPKPLIYPGSPVYLDPFIPNNSQNMAGMSTDDGIYMSTTNQSQNMPNTRVMPNGRSEFSSAFGLMSPDDAAVLAGIAPDGFPFFENQSQRPLVSHQATQKASKESFAPGAMPFTNPDPSHNKAMTRNTKEREMRTIREMWTAFLRDPTTGLVDGTEMGKPEFPAPPSFQQNSHLQQHPPLRSSSYSGEIVSAGTNSHHMPTAQHALHGGTNVFKKLEDQASKIAGDNPIGGTPAPVGTGLATSYDNLRSYEEAILSRKRPVLKLPLRVKTRDSSGNGNSSSGGGMESTNFRSISLSARTSAVGGGVASLSIQQQQQQPPTASSTSGVPPGMTHNTPLYTSSVTLADHPVIAMPKSRPRPTIANGPGPRPNIVGGGNANSAQASQPSYRLRIAPSQGGSGGGSGAGLISPRQLHASTQSSPHPLPNAHSFPGSRPSTSSAPSPSYSFAFAPPPHSFQSQSNANFQPGSLPSDFIISPTSSKSTSTSHQLVTALSNAGMLDASSSNRGRPTYKRVASQALEPFSSKRPHLRGRYEFQPDA